MNDSTPPNQAQTPVEEFSQPGITELASLRDGRGPGDYKSIYPVSVWVQIFAELTYLVAIQVLSFVLLAELAIYVVRAPKLGFVFDILGPYPKSAHLVTYASITLAGACGGCTFSLKWLYHTVAKMQWHRDRGVWRFVVPISSAFVAVFSGMMIISGLVPFLSKTPLMVPTTGAAYGFFVGLFSDNVLAALQRLAFDIFGTVDKRKIQGPDEAKPSSPSGLT